MDSDVRSKLMLILVLVATACTSRSDVPLPQGAHLVQDSGLNEMSGLEASPNHPGVLWSINDSGNAPTLYRLGVRGENMGRVIVRGAKLGDWETLAFWKQGGHTWLLIGDVGDNHAWRDHVRVYAVPEPAPGQEFVDVAWTLTFRYPDGPRDAEGIAVDSRDQSLLVLSKRDIPARLYRIPLAARHATKPSAAEFVTTVSQAPGKPFTSRPTGLDIAKDGNRMAVLTYRGLFTWRRSATEDWSSALRREAVAITMPRMAKAEAMAFGASHDELHIGSERIPTPLVTLAAE